MSDVSTWSATANANNAASPDGFPENMAPSGVNDSCREVMAAVKRADAENAKLSGATFSGAIAMGGNKIAGLPAGTTAGDALRYEQGAKLAGDIFTGLITLAAGADIASAATIDLTAATGNSPRITGTTATSAVTMNTGQQMVVVADGAWPLTYHSTTNKLNTAGANYTCAAGDIVYYYKGLSGVVYGTIFPASGKPIVGMQLTDTRFAIKSFTRALDAASGTVAYTGFGGTPKAVAIIASKESTSSKMMSIGFDGVGTSNRYGLTANVEGIAGDFMLNTGTVVCFYEAAGKRQAGVVSSFAADTVNIEWTRLGVTAAGAGTFCILAFF